MKTKELKKWSVASAADEFTHPDLCPPVLQGFVFGHDKFEDGKHIITSVVIGKRNGKVITKSGSEYVLLDIDPNYEKAFPNARKIVFDSLKEI
jgi:hypothetical protein